VRWTPVSRPHGGGRRGLGADSNLRAGLHERAIGYALASKLPSRAWNRLSAGIGHERPPLVRLDLIEVTGP
jgi:hypothetical protein